MRVSGFSPIAQPDAELLILGTLPGEVSLRKQEYYANKQNAFWSLMGSLLGISEDLDYQARARKLKENRIALWDVLRSAKRTGSMDARIKRDSECANDFVKFLGEHRRIRQILFNGQKAEELFRRLVLPRLESRGSLPGMTVLPSTSPANTHHTRSQKLAKWRILLRSQLERTEVA